VRPAIDWASAVASSCDVPLEVAQAALDEHEGDVEAACAALVDPAFQLPPQRQHPTRLPGSVASAAPITSAGISMAAYDLAASCAVSVFVAQQALEQSDYDIATAVDSLMFSAANASPVCAFPLTVAAVPHCLPMLYQSTTPNPQNLSSPCVAQSVTVVHACAGVLGSMSLGGQQHCEFVCGKVTAEPRVVRLGNCCDLFDENFSFRICAGNDTDWSRNHMQGC